MLGRKDEAFSGERSAKTDLYELTVPTGDQCLASVFLNVLIHPSHYSCFKFLFFSLPFPVGVLLFLHFLLLLLLLVKLTIFPVAEDEPVLFSRSSFPAGRNLCSAFTSHSCTATGDCKNFHFPSFLL